MKMTALFLTLLTSATTLVASDPMVVLRALANKGKEPRGKDGECSSEDRKKVRQAIIDAVIEIDRRHLRHQNQRQLSHPICCILCEGFHECYLAYPACDSDYVQDNCRRRELEIDDPKIGRGFEVDVAGRSLDNFEGVLSEKDEEKVYKELEKDFEKTTDGIIEELEGKIKEVRKRIEQINKMLEAHRTQSSKKLSLEARTALKNEKIHLKTVVLPPLTAELKAELKKLRQLIRKLLRQCNKDARAVIKVIETALQPGGAFEVTEDCQTLFKQKFKFECLLEPDDTP